MVVGHPEVLKVIELPKNEQFFTLKMLASKSGIFFFPGGLFSRVNCWFQGGQV